jgi:MoaA/NifB/PqqE/SkfB family radical SAM enzyme
MRDIERMLWRESVANRPKHWVRAVTACNSRCIFCLDSDTPRNVYLSEDEVKREIDRGRDELGAEKIIISGGEATLHPRFPEFVRYALERGYDRVQTVTNGYRLAERDFFEECLDAGLGEITFSLHGHTVELHDHLTQTPGAFRRIVKAITRALRDGRPIVNIDVVINKQNVAVIDKIVELGISLGVTEYDLLHVIPQAAAFDNRDQLFYEVREHLPVLQKVFRLNRHPRFVVWTNRFPVSYLEGLEDLIQDPHKMLDEVNGRRWQVRRYLDNGTPLDCRDPARCPHCFIEPFCTTMDRVIERQNAASWEVWWVGKGREQTELPYGARYLGVELDSVEELATLSDGIYAATSDAGALPAKLPARLVLVATTAEQLDAWIGKVELDVHLNRSTAAWLLEHRDVVERELERLRIHQPSHEHMRTAAEHDVRDPRAFFGELALPVRVSGLPPCLAPGALFIPERDILDAALFDAETGRLDIRALARHHVSACYRAKSVRCADCSVNDRCEGAPINMVRDQGLALLTPLTDEAVTAHLHQIYPQPLARLANGAPYKPVAPSLPGRPPPAEAPLDPLAVIALQRMERQAQKRKLPVL